MTHPSEAVEAVARALCEWDRLSGRFDDLPEAESKILDDEATALLDRIAPLLIAGERNVWVEAIETYFDATAVMDVEAHVSAIRARGAK